jgi:uncharacterized membrane protein
MRIPWATSIWSSWASAVLLATIPQVEASPIFTGLGVLPDGPQYSRAHEISGDGTTIVGESGSPNHGYGSPTSRLAFRWTEAGGMKYVGPADATKSRAFGVSRDGTVVVGDASAGFRWQGGTATYLSPPGSSLPWFAIGYDVSDDGSIVVGSAWIDSFRSFPAKWVGGAITFYSDTLGISLTARTSVGGQEIVSGAYDRAGGYEPALYRNGSPQPLGSLGPSAIDGKWYFGVAQDISRNGRAAVGYSSSSRAGADWYEAFRWTKDQGIVGLGDLPGGDYGSWAWATSANGSVVVGNSVTRYSPTYRHVVDAFYWTPTTGMKNLRTFLTDGFKLDLSGWTYLNDATGVDDSGLTIAGWGMRTTGNEEAFRVKLQQQIYINWIDQINTGFRAQWDAGSATYDAVKTPGTWPSLTVPPTLPDGSTADQFRDDVVDHVRSIFQNSGVDIDILDSRTSPPRSAALEVRFGPEVRDRNGKSLLYGWAWDVGPRGLPGGDRFNARWDGQVAVFADPSQLGINDNYTAEGLAETIAHEVGHGLGLRHVNPDGDSSVEVMDYTATRFEPEIFTDVVSPIIEPPTASGTPTGQSHNPVYHLKRYVLGVPTGASLPGSWDFGEITIGKFQLTSLSREVFNLTPLSLTGGDLEGDGWDNVAYFPTADPADLFPLLFFAYEGAPLRLMASSEVGETWDLFFGTGDPANPDLVFEDFGAGSIEGSIFRYDPQTQTYQVAGSFAGVVSNDLTLWGDTLVPEPTAAALLVAGIAFIVAWRKQLG